MVARPLPARYSWAAHCSGKMRSAADRAQVVNDGVRVV